MIRASRAHAVSYLGLDLGGSKCRYEWWPHGLAEGGDADTVQPAVHGVERTVVGLAEVLAFAARARRPEAAVCALAGAGDATTRAAIASGLEAHGIGFPVAVVGDVLAAAAAGLREGPGVLIWAGTGSFAVARGPDGRLVRVGGRGYAFGDAGSGYDLVRRALVAALLAVDGLGPATALTERLVAAFRAPAPERLGAVAQRLPPREVAAQAPAVLQVFQAGDPVAATVVREAAFSLVALAREAVQRVGLSGLEAGGVALGGGLLASGSAFAECVRQLVDAENPRSSSVRVLARHAAAEGAAWLAQGWHERTEPQHAWVEHVAL